MKIAIIGAAGIRTPLILQAIIRRQEQIGLNELALMDIDGDRLGLIGALTAPLESRSGFKITRTTDSQMALASADFVITTFRVGGIEARVIDEQVPLKYGILGQETTGAGGFAMAMRSIPVLLSYIGQMRDLCPEAWLINFANPAGMLTEAAIKEGGWERSIGICDAPSTMQQAAASVLSVQTDQIYLDYFGLNHLGWVRSVMYQGGDFLPLFIAMIRNLDKVPGLPFSPEFINALGMLPNEYLYYYYYNAQAVHNIHAYEQSRAEQVATLNQQLFSDLNQLKDQGDLEAMQVRYFSYLERRGETYMVGETGKEHTPDELKEEMTEALTGEGYAGVALDLIEGLIGSRPKTMILNIPNRGSLKGLAEDDVVEIPAQVGRGYIWPMAVGEIPDHCLGLIKQVKAYEHLTIQAATEGDYAKALLALTIHPLVRDQVVAKNILDEYREKHGALFPKLR